jgi:surface antigen
VVKMTLNEFRQKYLNKPGGADFDGQYGGQCVDLYRFYVKEVLDFPQSPGVGGAGEIWDSASPEYYDFIKNSPDNYPEPGDIVIWNRRVGGGFGHVAIVLDGNQNTFTSLDQNWDGVNIISEEVHNYSNVVGWLHPKENMADALQTCLADREKFWKERDELLAALGADSVEAGKSAIGGLKSRITDLSNQLGSAQAEVKNKEEILSRCQEQVTTLQDDINTLTDRLEGAAETIAELGKDKGTQAIEIEQLKLQIETLKQQATNGEVTLTFWELIQALLKQTITIKKG